MKYFSCCLISCLLFLSNLFSECYFEIYSGAVFEKIKVKDVKTKDTYTLDDLNASFNYSTTRGIDPRYMGGITLGGWFANSCACNNAKYLGLSLDSNAASLNFHLENPSTYVTYTQDSTGPSSTSVATKFSNHGFIVTTSLFFNMRFSAFPTCKQPFGILQPYIGVGPALVIIREDSTLFIESNIADGNGLGVYIFSDEIIKTSKKTYLSAGAVADLGLRIMVSRRVFLDGILKYCYTKPSLNNKTIRFHPKIHLFSFHGGLGYSF